MTASEERRVEEHSIDALCTMLTSPDPAIRDEIAFTELATRINGGEVDGALASLGDRMVALFEHPDIWARSFATLIVGYTIRRDAVTGELDAATVTRWRDAFAAWWSTETDLRGWGDQLGWLHAIAHGADTVRAFACSPRLGIDDLIGLMELVTVRLLTPTDYLFAHGEDDRVAYALAALLTHTQLGIDAATTLCAPIQAVLLAGEPGPVPPAISNTIRAVNSLYVAVHRGVRIESVVVEVPHRDAVLEQLSAVLRTPNGYLA